MHHGAPEDALVGLARDISRCPVVEDVLDHKPSPCSELVGQRGDDRETRWYVPEPWAGHIDTAPILFVGPNPGPQDKDRPFDYDRHMSRRDTDQALLAAANGTFDDLQYPGIANGERSRDRKGNLNRTGGHYYWNWTRETARELLGRPPVPGQDYALTEIVHCGCLGGNDPIVRRAAPICAGRYLTRVVDASPAGIIVLAGHIARDFFRREFESQFTGDSVPVPGRSDLWVWRQGELRGVLRYVITLPHPSRRGLFAEQKTISGNLGPELTEEVCAFARALDRA